MTNPQTMNNVIITLLVDSTALLLDPNMPLQKCCTLAQLGGLLTADTTDDLTNYISDVNIGDNITWNGIANSTSRPGNIMSSVVNISGITATTVFGQTQLLPISLSPGATGGTAVYGQISFGSEGDMVTYTISFNIVVYDGENSFTSPTYTIDPKIRVHQP